MQGSIQLINSKISFRSPYPDYPIYFIQSPQRPPAVIGTKYVATPATVLFPEIVSSNSVGRYDLEYQEKKVLRVYCKNTTDADSPGIGTHDDPITSFAQAVNFCFCLHYFCKCGFEYLQIIILPESERINLSDLGGYFNAEMPLIVGDMDAETKTEAYLDRRVQPYSVILANLEIKDIRADLHVGTMMYKCETLSSYNVYAFYAIGSKIDCDRLIMQYCFGCDINCNHIEEDGNVIKDPIELVANSRLKTKNQTSNLVTIKTLSNSIFTFDVTSSHSYYREYDFRIYYIYDSTINASHVCIDNVYVFSGSTINATERPDVYRVSVCRLTGNPIVSNSTINAICQYNIKSRYEKGFTNIGLVGLEIDAGAQPILSGFTANLSVQVTARGLSGYKYDCVLARSLGYREMSCLQGCNHSKYGNENPSYSFDCQSFHAAEIDLFI